MRLGFPLGIVLGAALASPLAAQAPAGALTAILLAEDRRGLSEEDRRVLLDGLRSPDLPVLRRSLRALGRLERPDFLPVLLLLLRHRDPGVRAEAVLAVAQAAQGFGSAAPGSDRGAGWAMALDALGRLAVEDSEPPVLAMVALALGRLPYDTPDEIVEARRRLLLLQGRLPPDAPEQVDAARALETIARLTARRVPLDDTLRRRLTTLARSRDRDPEIARHALGGLLAAQAAADTTLAEALTAPDPWLRRLAAGGLLRVADTLLRDRLLETAAADSAPPVRVEAVRVLGRLGGPGPCRGLVQAAADPVPAVALLALDGIGSACAADSLAPRLLAGALRDGDWHRPAHALLSLARLDPGAARAALPGTVGSPVWQARMYGARAAAVLRDTTTLARLAADSSPNVREAAIAGLRDVAGHAADSLYREALAADDYQLVLTAAGALAGTTAPAEAAGVLFAALERITRERRETSRDPRVGILVRLREVGDEEQAALLRPYLRDFDPVVADSAAAILSAWTGQPAAAAPERLAPAAIGESEVEQERDRLLRVTMASGGVFDVELFVDDAPVTVARVLRLVRRGYYDGLGFQRVVPNFVIQGGSPGANEYMGDGPFMRDELGPRSHRRGTLGISTRGRDTGDGQIFVNLVDNPRLDFDYTVWGRVVAGMDAVDAVQEGDVIRRVEIVPR